MIPEIIFKQIKKYNKNDEKVFNKIFFEKSFFEKNLSDDGLHNIKFDKSLYNFEIITKDIIEEITNQKFDCDLEDIHKYIDKDFIDLIEDGLTTRLQYIFYEYVQRFTEVYIEFLKKTIRPTIKQDFYFQKKPTFRIFFPNPNWKLFTKPFYHSDVFLGHPLEMINIWFPITKSYGSNSIAYTDLNLSKKLYNESNCNFVNFYNKYYEQDSKLYDELFSNLKTFDSRYGELMYFDSRCLHGTSQNQTEITRISIDFRIIPVHEYENFKISYSGTGRMQMQMNLGNYYSLRSIDEY